MRSNDVDVRLARVSSRELTGRRGRIHDPIEKMEGGALTSPSKFRTSQWPVPELTCRTDFKLNGRLSLRHHPNSLSPLHRTISHVRAHRGNAVRLAALFLSIWIFKVVDINQMQERTARHPRRAVQALLNPIDGICLSSGGEAGDARSRRQRTFNWLSGDPDICSRDRLFPAAGPQLGGRLCDLYFVLPGRRWMSFST